MPRIKSSASHKSCRALPGGAGISGADKPVRSSHAGVEHHITDFRRGIDRHRHFRSVRDLPQFEVQIVVAATYLVLSLLFGQV